MATVAGIIIAAIMLWYMRREFRRMAQREELIRKLSVGR